MIGATLVLDLVPNPFVKPIDPGKFSYFLPLAGSWSALQGLLAACVGAYIAKVNFTGAAVLVGAATSLFAIRMLQYIAEPVEPVAFTEILARNSVGIAITIVAIAIGAEIGRWIAKRNEDIASNAA